VSLLKQKLNLQVVLIFVDECNQVCSFLWTLVYLNVILKFWKLAVVFLVSSCSLDSQTERTESVFHELIESNYHLAVFEWNGEGKEILQEIALDTLEVFRREPRIYDRTNELGLGFERILQQSFVKKGIECSIPKTQSGRGQNTGYPDLTFEYKGQCYYLEVKTFSTSTINSSQRTFYFTVSDDPKISQDAFHLLIGFEVVKSDDSHYQILRYHILDLRNLPCKVKVEYNASNKDLYNNNIPGYRIIGSLESE